MKKILLTIALASVASLGFSQGGLVGFANDTSSYITNSVTQARVPTGSSFLAQLYYGAAGAAENQLVSVTNPPVNFGLPGRITAGGRTLDSAIVPPGGNGTFQIRAWEAVLGSNWETALANWTTGTGNFAGKVLGKSNLVTIKTADPTAVPPPTPAALTGLLPFQLVVVPEPGMLALFAIGIAGLILRRRK